MKERKYIAIDLKSFYASVECVDRGLDPLDTNLVVADESRTEKTICLAVSPSMKKYGIGGRARLFEVVEKIRDVNYKRSKSNGGKLVRKSVSEKEILKHNDYEVDYLIAPPQMAHYMEYSTRIYQIYLKYVASSDIHVYSIDEVIMDVTDYLDTMKVSAHEMCMMMIRDVLKNTGITATGGVGTNMYLCKVAMDIVAKHIPADRDGVRIAELDEMSYRRLLWDHKPLTSFWRVGQGIAAKLLPYGIDTMGKIARCSIEHEDFLYGLFGVNAELLIDHAWGWEPCTIEAVKSYRPSASSLSSGQVLSCAYDWRKTRVVVKEMADSIALSLVDKKLVTDHLVLTIGYDKDSLEDGKAYEGELGKDYYGRTIPKHGHGTLKLDAKTSSSSEIIGGFMKLFDRIADENLLVRRLNVTVCDLVDENISFREKKMPVQLDLFTDYEKQKEEDLKKRQKSMKERRIQEALLDIKRRYGKNSILKGMNFDEGATAIERNSQIGGHKA